MAWRCGPRESETKSAFSALFPCFLESRFPRVAFTSGGGLGLVRELDERLGPSELIEQDLTDFQGENTQLPLAGLFTQPSERLCTQKPGWSIAY
jgi:hypothetical protein